MSGTTGSRVLMLFAFLLLSGCLGYPATVKPITGFESDRYLGRWYEVARLDHSFERGLTRVTADYSPAPDGGLTVINRGFQPDASRWDEAQGKAYFVEDPDTGYLKVSFFGPFYGSYVIFELDREDYSWALVCGPDLSYLWILSRTPTLAPEVLEDLLGRAHRAGFNVGDIILVPQ